MLFNKPLADIEEHDLQTLVDNVVREGREIEYKEALTIHTDVQKQEFLNDVSSFANTTGGLLFYGIRESKTDAGVPLEICGLKGENPGKRIGDMETIIRTGLEPHLLGVSMHSVLLPSHDGRAVIILSIPKSFAAPHMVKSSGRFYSRGSTGKFPLDVTQIRAAFELVGTTAERIRSFRIERLSRISAGEETPAPLNEEEPKLVLHLVPLNAFSTTVSLDLKPLNVSFEGKLLDKGKLLKPLSVWDNEAHVTMRFNIDGFARSTRAEFNSSATIGYTQVFRNGSIETVDMTILGVYENNGFNGEIYEKRLLETVKRFIDLQQLLGVDPPVFIMVSFLGVKGYRILHKVFYSTRYQASDEIDRMNLIIPEVIVEDFVGDLAEIMRPIFDTVWNAAGYIASPNYDEAGKFRFNY